MITGLSDYTILSAIKASVLDRHDYYIFYTKNNFKLFHLMCLCSSGFSEHRPINESTDHLRPD